MDLNPFSSVHKKLDIFTQLLSGILTKEIRMLKEIEDLKAQVKANVEAEAKVAGDVTSLKAQVADLSAKLDVAVAGVMTAEDKAAIVQATADLAASVKSIV